MVKHPPAPLRSPTNVESGPPAGIVVTSRSPGQIVGEGAQARAVLLTLAGWTSPKIAEATEAGRQRAPVGRRGVVSLAGLKVSVARQAVTWRRRCVSLHRLGQVLEKVSASICRARDQARKPRSSPSGLRDRGRCVFPSDALSLRQPDSTPEHSPGNWRCVRASAPPSTRRRRADEQVRQPRLRLGPPAPICGATIASSPSPSPLAF